MAEQPSPAPFTISPHRVAWKADTPTKRTKRLWFDAAANRVVQLTRFEPGARLEVHRHLGHEVIYVIEGDVVDEAGPVIAGGLSFRPTGCVHSVSSTNGSTSFAIVTGGNEDARMFDGAPQSRIYVPSAIGWIRESPQMRRKTILPREGDAPLAAFVSLEAGAALPRYRHDGEEFIFVLEGSYADEFGEVRSGDFQYLPDGCVRGVASKSGVTFLSITYRAERGA